MKLYFLFFSCAALLLSCSSKERAQGHVTQGTELFKKQDYVGAIDEYSKAIAIDSNNFEAILNRGSAYDNLGNKQKAFDDYNRAIHKNPNSEFGYYERGLAYLSGKKHDLAIKDFSKAIDIFPNYAESYYQRGICFYLEGKKQKAIDDLKDAIRIKPNYIDAIKALDAIRGQQAGN